MLFMAVPFSERMTKLSHADIRLAWTKGRGHEDSDARPSQSRDIRHFVNDEMRGFGEIPEVIELGEYFEPGLLNERREDRDLQACLRISHSLHEMADLGINAVEWGGG